MNHFFLSIPLKYRYYIPIVSGILLMVVLITPYSVNRAKSIIDDSIKDMLSMELATIRGLFEREREHRIERINIAARAASEIFHAEKLLITSGLRTVRAVNQITGREHDATYEEWFYNSRPLFGDTILVDRIAGISNISATIFQRIDSGFLRIATTIIHKQGKRATGTYIPMESPVSVELNRGNIFMGRAFVVNDWYNTIYQPIQKNEIVLGALYVGSREKDLQKLREIFHQIRIGESGYPFVLDGEGNLLIHPNAEGENWRDEPFIKRIIGEKNGFAKYRLIRDSIEKMAVFTFFEEYGLYLGATVPVKDISAGILNKIIINSVAIGLLVIIVLSVIIYFVTVENNLPSMPLRDIYRS
jgi:methyl-accepting chemotaxis protein